MISIINRHLVIVFVVALFLLVISSETIADPPQQILSIQLIYPRKPGESINRPKVSTRPVTVTGEVTIKLLPEDDRITAEANRYQVKCYLDDTLIHSTEAVTQDEEGRNTFIWLWDSTEYPDGKYKIIVNLWDNQGAAAIGIKNILIQN